MKNLVWTKGTGGLDGEFQSASEVDFYIDRVRGACFYKCFYNVFINFGNVLGS